MALLWQAGAVPLLGPAGLRASFLVLSEEWGGAAGRSLTPRLGVVSNVWHPGMSLKEKALNIARGALVSLHCCIKVNFNTLVPYKRKLSGCSLSCRSCFMCILLVCLCVLQSLYFFNGLK